MTVFMRWRCIASRRWGTYTAKPRHRSFSTTLQDLKVEQVEVSCRSNGSIKLDIFNLRPTEQLPPIIYLPRGPLLPTGGSLPAEEEVVIQLAFRSGLPVVRINYRLYSPQYLYPTPIHDVLAGYDWVTEHLLPAAFVTRYGRRSGKKITKVGVCGDLVGGSLATMLAMTECKLVDARIGAAAVGSPLLDWVFPEPVEEELEPVLDGKKKRRKRKPRESWLANGNNPSLPSAKLYQMRDRLFRKPAHYFDPFASPVLFFRSASEFLPGAWEMVAVRDEDVDGNTEGFGKIPKPRRTLRNYPPTGTGQRLPDMLVSTSPTSVLYDQTQDFVKLFRRSVVRSNSARTLFDDNPDHEEELKFKGDDPVVEAAKQEAERRMNVYETIDDIGMLTGAGTQGAVTGRIQTLAEWFRARLTQT